MDRGIFKQYHGSPLKGADETIVIGFNIILIYCNGLSVLVILIGCWLARLIVIGWRSAETRHGATTHSTMLRFLKHFSILNVYEGLFVAMDFIRPFVHKENGIHSLLCTVCKNNSIML